MNLHKFLKERLDPEIYSIGRFVQASAASIFNGASVLDAGAGSCPYKDFFKHTQYESCDFGDIFDKKSLSKHDFLCDLAKIPKPENYYDCVLNTQVLEHVPDPQLVLCEFFRILKPGGRLFITVPQGWGIHGAPYHFFNFTRYGLQLLLERAGFQNIYIKEKGGYFWYLSKRLSTLPRYTLHQYKPKSGEGLTQWLLFVVLGGIYVVIVPIFCWMIPFFLFYLDKLDKTKLYTLGYTCTCDKGVL